MTLTSMATGLTSPSKAGQVGATSAENSPVSRGGAQKLMSCVYSGACRLGSLGPGESAVKR
jgi:hypothetical protein